MRCRLVLFWLWLLLSSVLIAIVAATVVTALHRKKMHGCYRVKRQVCVCVGVQCAVQTCVVLVVAEETAHTKPCLLLVVVAGGWKECGCKRRQPKKK